MHIDYSRVPDHCRPGIRRYIEKGKPPGDFIQAVLQDSLSGAYGRADHINQERMQDWVTFMYNEAPGSCWGSREAVEAWIEQGGLEGLEAEV